MTTTGVLMLGFGGPQPGCCGRRAVCPKTAGCEAECFVAGILGDNPARMGRIHEVTAHYQHTGGGYSPFNPLTFEQADALQRELRRRGEQTRVACGFRHWTPWVKDGLASLAGVDRVILLVMAPHQSSVSWDWYLKQAGEAAEALGASAPPIVGVVQPWFAAPGFIAATAAQVTGQLLAIPVERRATTRLIFTAHAIPEPVERTSPYRQQFIETARLAAQAAGIAEHRIAFQSQPGDSRIPWSAPTIEAELDTAKADGMTDVVVQAAGFLVDHTEVLFDLDHEAREHAEQLGLQFHRASCVHTHSAFIGTLADGVVSAMRAHS